MKNSFHRIGPLGRFVHRVAMSVCMFVCPFSCDFFEASHWPSVPMIRSRPLIGRPPLLLLLLRPTPTPTPTPPSSSSSSCIGPTIRIGREIQCLPYAGFSSNRPTGPIRSSSREVCPWLTGCVCVFVCPLPMRFFSKPLIGPQVT